MSKKVWITKDKFKDVMKGLELLSGTIILVGIPQDKAPRKGDELNNATIGYIHDKGAPEANIPARPWLEAGIEDVKGAIGKKFRALVKRAVEPKSGGAAPVEQGLNAIGLFAQNAVKRKISTGPFTPLKSSTLRGRIASGKGVKGAKAALASRAEGNGPGSSLARPLIHTGELRNSITYVLEKRHVTTSGAVEKASK